MNAALLMQTREDALARQIQDTDCTTAEQARCFVAFALACVRDTPVSNGLPLSSLLRGRPVLEEVLRLAARWLAGESVANQLEQSDDVVLDAAAEAGEFTARATGLRAAFWSVSSLYEAVSAAGGAGTDETELNEVAANAGLAAYLARKASDEGLTLAAVEYQERLFATIIGGGSPIS